MLFVLALIFRLPGALILPPEVYYNNDELQLASSSLMLVASLTPDTLAWPSGTTLFALNVLYYVDFAVHNPQILTAGIQGDLTGALDILSDYICGFFDQPGRLLTLGRLLVALLSSLLSPTVYIFMKRKVSAAAAIGSGLIAASSPFLIMQGHLLMGDSLAAVFFAVSLYWLVFGPARGRWTMVVPGLLLGLAVATKFIYLAFLPVGLAWVFFKARKEANSSHRALVFPGAFTLSFILALLVFMPYIWTAPLTLAKAFLGNLSIRQGGEGSSWLYIGSSVLPSFLNYAGMAVCTVGLFRSYRGLGAVPAGFCLLAAALFLFPVGSASFIYPRYLFPVLPVLIIYLGLGLDWLVQLFERKNFAFAGTALTVGVLLLYNLALYVAEFRQTHSPANIVYAADWIKKNAAQGTRIAVPSGMRELLAENQKSLERHLAVIESRAAFKDRIKNLLESVGVNPDEESLNSPLIPAVLGEDERKWSFRIKLMIRCRGRERPQPKNFDLYYYNLTDLPTFFSSREHPLARFNSGELDVMVLESPVPEIERLLAASFLNGRGKDVYIYSR
jgi:hypothetical protein